MLRAGTCWRYGLLKNCGEGLIAVTLMEGRGITDIIDLVFRFWMCSQMEKGGGGVITMDLVEKPSSVLLNEGTAVK